MKEECYFMVYGGEDGLYIQRILKKDIESHLKEWANPDETEYEFLDDIPQDLYNQKREYIKDYTLEQGEIILIKGKIVKPYPKTRVTEYEVE